MAMHMVEFTPALHALGDLSCCEVGVVTSTERPNIVSASPRTHLLLLCCFKERGALGIEGTNVGTIPEMVVLVNPNGDYMVRVKAQRWGCYRSTGQKKKIKPERM